MKAKASALILASLLGTAAVAQSTDTMTPSANAVTNTPEGPNTPGQTTEQMATPNTTANTPDATTDSSTSPGMAASSMAPSQTDTANYPTCSRGVSDKCVQGHATGRRMTRTHRPRSR